MEELSTKRLLLRKIREDDAQRIFECWASDDDVTKYLTWNPHQNIETTKTIMKSWLEAYKNEDCYRYGIELKETKELIGMIDVVSFDNNQPIIGYVLGKAYWNHGYMSEAFEAVINKLFEDGYHRILIEADERNIGSNKVILKNGFTFFKKETKQCSNFKPYMITTNWYYKSKE